MDPKCAAVRKQKKKWKTKKKCVVRRMVPNYFLHTTTYWTCVFFSLILMSVTPRECQKPWIRTFFTFWFLLLRVFFFFCGRRKTPRVNITFCLFVWCVCVCVFKLPVIVDFFLFYIKTLYLLNCIFYFVIHIFLSLLV